MDGHFQFRKASEEAEALLKELVSDHQAAQTLAEGLMTILEGVIRTSWAEEKVASILKP